ncbi:hypothetical protein EPK99_10395 [Neorhizobium lilium]|uniref:Uncharacterized protein n=1 Tax=Neorhizobium lilium TaxID=2503024 RepID=A0A3S3RIK8_9HYPH|nr:hypothetical protein [Neorhizobium lilium]RWX78975.1 hypothetical protein EPK99_10395 [Neorhizobium lilium]
MTYMPMIALAAVLISGIGFTGWWILNHWKASKAPTGQVPPEVPTRRWLRREAKNARDAKRRV